MKAGGLLIIGSDGSLFSTCGALISFALLILLVSG